MDLFEKVAVVTGASRRLGREIALGLGRAGASVVVHYGQSQQEAEETVSALEALGVGAWPVQADLADPEAIMEMFAEVDGRCSRLDILVNSAASFETKPLEEVSVGDWSTSAPPSSVCSKPRGECGPKPSRRERRESSSISPI
jgi:NAD(P)-dependent dehydrogenase (short-subunit alcohol dehydrogenase family)